MLCGGGSCSWGGGVFGVYFCWHSTRLLKGESIPSRSSARLILFILRRSVSIPSGRGLFHRGPAPSVGHKVSPNALMKTMWIIRCCFCSRHIWACELALFSATTTVLTDWRTGRCSSLRFTTVSDSTLLTLLLMPFFSFNLSDIERSHNISIYNFRHVGQYI